MAKKAHNPSAYVEVMRAGFSGDATVIYNAHRTVSIVCDGEAILCMGPVDAVILARSLLRGAAIASGDLAHQLQEGMQSIGQGKP